MSYYLRNKATGEIHHKHRDEKCNADDMLDENKDKMTFAELVEFIQKGGIDPSNFCAWCWTDESD